jgi:tetratricopeptide (TPR) repeat protein
MPEEFNEADADAELGRLRAKQAAIDDEDIRLALQARIDSLESQLIASKHPTPAAPDPKPEAEPIPVTTPEQARQADQLIRQSKVEKMRNNSQRALTLMKEAAAIAPASPTVLEAFADDLMERRQYKDALATYKQALVVDPRNVGLETKYAKTALRLSGSGLSFDQQLRAGLNDSLVLTGDDAVASVVSARFLNAFAPGVGHMVLGRFWTGVSILICYMIAVGWIVLMRNDVSGIVQMVAGKSAHPNLVVLIPLFVAIVIWMGTQAALSSGDRSHARVKMERPKPPVDLPFE